MSEWSRPLPRLLLIVVIGSSVWNGARRQWESVRFASQLRTHSMEERRAILFAPWYAEVTSLAATLPESASVDVVMLTPQARDVAVLAGPLLQPRDVRYFDGRGAWLRRERARFLHDDKASNAIPGPPPGAAAVTLSIDPAGTPMIRVMR